MEREVDKRGREREREGWRERDGEREGGGKIVGVKRGEKRE